MYTCLYIYIYIYISWSSSLEMTSIPTCVKKEKDLKKDNIFWTSCCYMHMPALDGTT